MRPDATPYMPRRTAIQKEIERRRSRRATWTLLSDPNTGGSDGGSTPFLFASSTARRRCRVRLSVMLRSTLAPIRSRMGSCSTSITLSRSSTLELRTKEEMFPSEPAVKADAIWVSPNFFSASASRNSKKSMSPLLSMSIISTHPASSSSVNLTWSLRMSVPSSSSAIVPPPSASRLQKAVLIAKSVARVSTPSPSSSVMRLEKASQSRSSPVSSMRLRTLSTFISSSSIALRTVVTSSTSSVPLPSLSMSIKTPRSSSPASRSWNSSTVFSIISIRPIPFPS
mmetsp:Transcript_26590/g.87160  ORF Transcript_26590/g.87160 Transcript_26590/m.87160 type:complete len:283 (+) Transcript_26590:1132-1980(+)